MNNYSKKILLESTIILTTITTSGCTTTVKTGEVGMRTSFGKLTKSETAGLHFHTPFKGNIQKLNLLKKLGVKISLDDFGTGYSSLGYLHQFPFDILKIDRCFISNINQNHKNAVITKSVIEMAHQLDLKVVAEGVETQAELDFLLKHKCDEVQGHFFARALPVIDFEKLLISDKEFFTVSPQAIYSS